MNSLEIHMLLQINVGAELEDLGSKDRRDAIQKFLSENLVTQEQYGLSPYSITQRGEAYIGFLMALPLPVARWEIPKAVVKGPTEGLNDEALLAVFAARWPEGKGVK